MLYTHTISYTQLPLLKSLESSPDHTCAFRKGAHDFPWSIMQEIC